MSNGSEHMAEMIWIDGIAHERLDIEGITRIAYDTSIPLNLPVGAGWATMKPGAAHLCAWLEAPESVTA